MQEQHRVGIQYLEAATQLLHRVRRNHQTAGLLEAADLQWWWRTARSTDGFPQLFWFDDSGRPEAAVIATDWGDGITLDPIFMPGTPPERIAQVVGRALAHATQSGFDAIDVVIDSADHVMRQVLGGHGFTVAQEQAQAVVDAWLDASARPPVSLLHKAYRLCSRLERQQHPHHMVPRNGAALESRLRQTSLYRPSLDLLVLDNNEEVAAYGLFWLDPDTAVGLVEPMRTENQHQRLGLARHLLTAGIDLLCKAGAKRIKLCFKPENVAARALYLNAGFKPGKQTMVLSRKAAPSAA